MIELSLLSLPFFQRALLAAVILSVLMSTLGVFVVLRRMSFFADAIGHAALTGIALALLLDINPFLSAIVYSLLVAVGIATTRRRTNLPFDTLLGVFFSASVALGVILVQRTAGYQANLISFLFGDILTVSNFDLVLIVLTTLITTGVLVVLGKKFISITFNPNLARAEGIAVDTYELIFLLILAALIALAIKFVGIILVTAMLIIPAASAQNLAASLSRMFLLSALFGLISAIAGMLASVSFNTASGPTVILAATVIFAASLLLRPFLKTGA